jgi:HEAT repeat protein
MLLLFLNPVSPGEPSYGGRTLSYWYSEYDEAHSIGSVDSYRRSIASKAAVRAMGTNAIPALLEWIQAEKRPVRDAIGRLMLRHYYDANDRRNMAWWGFDILGDKANSAGPSLAEMTKHKDRDIRNYALECLEHVHSPRDVFLPVLTRMIRDPNQPIREEAASCLIRLFPEDAEQIGVRRVSPGVLDFGTNAPAYK